MTSNSEVRALVAAAVFVRGGRRVADKMSWVHGKDFLLDIKLKHVPFVVVIIWLFALGLTLRVEQSSTYGTSNHIIERLQNPKRSQNLNLEKAIKSQLNLKKIRVAKEDRLKKGRAGQSVNEEVAEIVSLHKDSGNPHLLIAFTNDAEANSMKVLKIFTTQIFYFSSSVLPLQSQRVREGATVVEASCDHNRQVRNF